MQNKKTVFVNGKILSSDGARATSAMFAQNLPAFFARFPRHFHPQMILYLHDYSTEFAFLMMELENNNYIRRSIRKIDFRTGR
jgi:hypothetical protein